MVDEQAVVTYVSDALPDVQAVYLFGSYATGEAWPDSDVDIALLLPHDTAKRMRNLAMADLHNKLESALKRNVDLVNLRRVSTVFQNEIVTTGNVLYCSDETARQTFEMLVLSFYLKLNEERREVLDDGLRTGRFYDP